MLYAQSIAAAAAVIAPAVVQPSRFSSGGLTCSPITLWSLVNLVTKAIKGGARTPFSTAD